MTLRNQGINHNYIELLHIIYEEATTIIHKDLTQGVYQSWNLFTACLEEIFQWISGGNTKKQMSMENISPTSDLQITIHPNTEWTTKRWS